MMQTVNDSSLIVHLASRSEVPALRVAAQLGAEMTRVLRLPVSVLGVAEMSLPPPLADAARLVRLLLCAEDRVSVASTGASNHVAGKCQRRATCIMEQG